MAQVNMHVVSTWRALQLFALSAPDGPSGLHFRGSGPDDFLCGRCAAVLAAGMSREDLVAAAMRCVHCGRWNVIGKSPHA